MNSFFSPLLTTIFMFASVNAAAALDIGETAPDFSALASLAGQPHQFELATALQAGPVVLYFYPAAFTPGCTIEAHSFAEATDEFAKYNATIIGVSADDIETLHRFSVSECRDKFAVAADEDGSIMQAYDATSSRRPDVAGRISYVISPEGKVTHVQVSSPPKAHVSETLAAVKALSGNTD